MKERITFEQFIRTFNFRDFAGYNNEFKKDVLDTRIIRIYLPYDYDEYKEGAWFEFGINDFSETDYKWGLCEKIFSDDILNSYVATIQYNLYDVDLALQVYLSKEKKDNY